MLQPDAQRRVVPEAVELVSSRSRWERFGVVIEIIEAEDVAKCKPVDRTGGGHQHRRPEVLQLRQTRIHQRTHE